MNDDGRSRLLSVAIFWALPASATSLTRLLKRW